MTTQDLLEKMQWNINRALDSGVSVGDIVLTLEAIKFKVVEATLTNKPKPQSSIIPANILPANHSPK